MAQICEGCKLSVDPIRIFARSPATGKNYLIYRCPRDRCGFNIDIESYDSIRTIPNPDKKKHREGD